MIISFFGHSSLLFTEELYKKIKLTIINNIKKDEKTLFYCGGYGGFDHMCAKACRYLRETLPCCEVVFVTPYITESQQKKIKYLMETNLYDSILYPPIENVPLKYAINKRNMWMVEQSDLVIAYVNNTFGGAYTALEYAIKKGKYVINLAE